MTTPAGTLDLARLHRRSAAVAELSRAALAGAAVPELFQAAADLAIRELPGIDSVCVGELTPDGLRRLAWAGGPWDQPAVSVSPESAALTAMRSVCAGQSIVITDWDEQDRFPQPESLRVQDVKSSAFLPILADGGKHVFGLLGAHGRRPRVFPEHDITFLETIANVLGDFVARHRAQQRAIREAERFRSLAENSPDLIARFDADLRMEYVNGTVERVTGAPLGQLTGRTLREVGLPEPQVSALELALAQVLRTGMARSVNVDVHTVRGRRTFQTRMAPEIDAENRVQSVVATARDITELQHANRERAVIYQQLLAQQTELRELLARLVGAHQLELAREHTELRLTERERRILDLIARGWSNREISRELAVSYSTVKSDVTRILQKLDVSDRAQAAAQAVHLGLARSSEMAT